jgi:hypothetical protein
MQVHLGLWDAGDPSTAAGTVEWAGGYTDFTKAPFTSYVKSVSITNANPCASYSYAGTSGLASSIMCGNQTAMAGTAPQQVNGNQAPGSATTAAPGSASTASNGTVYVTVMDPECGCMKTHTSAMPAATEMPASNATVPYVTPAAPSVGSYTGAAGRLVPFGGLRRVLSFFF